MTAPRPGRFTASLAIVIAVVAFGFWNNNQRNEATREIANATRISDAKVVKIVRILCRTNIAIVKHDRALPNNPNTVADPARIRIIEGMVAELEKMPGDPCGTRETPNRR